jgi:hypothetical protein
LYHKFIQNILIFIRLKMNMASKKRSLEVEESMESDASIDPETEVLSLHELSLALPSSDQRPELIQRHISEEDQRQKLIQRQISEDMKKRRLIEAEDRSCAAKRSVERAALFKRQSLEEDKKRLQNEAYDRRRQEEWEEVGRALKAAGLANADAMYYTEQSKQEWHTNRLKGQMNHKKLMDEAKRAAGANV